MTWQAIGVEMSVCSAFSSVWVGGAPFRGVTGETLTPSAWQLQWMGQNLFMPNCSQIHTKVFKLQQPKSMVQGAALRGQRAGLDSSLHLETMLLLEECALLRHELLLERGTSIVQVRCSLDLCQIKGARLGRWMPVGLEVASSRRSFTATLTEETLPIQARKGQVHTPLLHHSNAKCSHHIFDQVLPPV
jgi:hypothetical protein